MKNKEDLKKELIKIDHKSYGMYKRLEVVTVTEIIFCI